MAVSAIFWTRRSWAADVLAIEHRSRGVQKNNGHLHDHTGLPPPLFSSRFPVNAAASQLTTVRCTHEPRRRYSRRPGPTCSLPPRSAGIGLEDWPQCAYRYPLEREQCDQSAKYAAELVALAPDI